MTMADNAEVKPAKTLQTTKNQHVVPRCYLREWCDERGHLWAYKLGHGHISNPSSKSAATRERIYDTADTLNPKDPENYQIFEKTFGRIEDMAESILKPILIKARYLHSTIAIPPESTRITATEAERLIRFTVVQFLRDGRQFERIKEGWDDWMRQAWDITTAHLFGPEEEPQVQYERINKDFMTEWLMEYLQKRLLRFSAVLEKKTLVMGLNKTAKRLLTSDSPVHWTGQYIDALQHWDGIDTASSRMVYPLAPDVAAIFYDRKHYRAQRAHHLNMRHLMPDEIREFNEHLALQSDQQVFSKDGDFSHVDYAFAQRRIQGWTRRKQASTKVPEYLLNALLVLGTIRKYTKLEWKALIQFDNYSPAVEYAEFRRDVLSAFDTQYE